MFNNFSIDNVQDKIKQNAGRICYGWIFLLRSSIDIPDGDYLIAEHHAVWCSPSGNLIDITPFHDNPKHHPWAPEGKVLFLVDDKAMPIFLKEGIVGFGALPSRFYPLINNENIAAHLKKLEQKVKQECEQIYALYGKDRL